LFPHILLILGLQENFLMLFQSWIFRYPMIEEIRNLNDDEIISLRDLIDLRIQDMEGYLDIIKQEEIIQN
jgi:hypothetical protein